MAEQGNETDERWQRREDILQAAVVVEGGLAVLALLVGGALGYPPGDAVHLDGMGLIWGVIGALPICLLGLLAIHAPWRPFQNIRDVIDENFMPAFRDCGISDILGLALVAGICEEMLFRGVLQAAMAEWQSPAFTIAILGILFGIVHFITPLYAFLATLVGIYLGWLFYYSNNLIAPALAHSFYDFFIILLLLRTRPLAAVPPSES